MNNKIKADVLNVLHQIIHLIDKRDFYALNELSNHTIHNSSIYQDPDSNQIAVITYALSKMVEHSKDKDFTELKKKFIFAMQDLETENIISYRSKMQEMIKEIGEMDSKLQVYIGEVIELAKIKKGGKIYDHGVSMSRAAEILGISQWDLMRYVGRTKIIDRLHPESKIKEKLELARSILG